jgi:hypothetical protein
VHLAVTLLPEIPQPLVVHLLVLGRGNETRGGFRLVDRPVAVDFGAARLWLGPRAQRLGGALSVVEATAVPDNGMGVVLSQQLRVQHGRRRAHATTPFRICAIWMNLIGTPMRSAQPC